MSASFYTFDSIDAYRSFIHDYGVDAFQFSAGKLRVNNHSIQFKNMVLTHYQVNREIIHFTKGMGKRLVIVVPCEDEKALVDGHVIGKSQLFIRVPCETGVSKFPENFCAVHVEFDLNVLNQFFNQQQIHMLWQNIANHTIERVQTKEAMDLCQLALSIYHTADKSDPLTRVSLEKKMLIALHNMLKRFTIKALKPCVNTRKNTVFRALKSLQENPFEPINVMSLAKLACCSKRTLEYAFKETLGCSPKQYLKVRKLHLIRDELINADNKSVKQVLTQFNEKNQARFTSDYFALFGDMPTVALTI